MTAHPIQDGLVRLDGTASVRCSCGAWFEGPSLRRAEVRHGAHVRAQYRTGKRRIRLRASAPPECRIGLSENVTKGVTNGRCIHCKRPCVAELARCRRHLDACLKCGEIADPETRGWTPGEKGGRFCIGCDALNGDGLERLAEVLEALP